MPTTAWERPIEVMEAVQIEAAAQRPLISCSVFWGRLRDPQGLYKAHALVEQLKRVLVLSLLELREQWNL